MTHGDFSEKRINQMKSWLANFFDSTQFELELASSDASFRRYFRVFTTEESLIVMDAPPSREDINPFIEIAMFMLKQGIHVPKIIASDPEHGFLLLSDFGSIPYLDALHEQSADYLYQSAIDSLIAMQLMPVDKIKLPAYSSTLLQQEMALFPEWFLAKHLAIPAPGFLTEIFSLLTDSALEQPQVFVHRDYHSRNLMHTKINTPGIIDFQDAVIGPVSYDLVSLLRDCYIEWSDDKLAQWLGYYYTQAIGNKVFDPTISIETFSRWFDWMGLQRHLKVLGIFSRLHYRDGKSNYINDLPLTLKYVLKISSRYPEFAKLNTFLQQETIMAIR